MPDANTHRMGSQVGVDSDPHLHPRLAPVAAVSITPSCPLWRVTTLKTDFLCLTGSHNMAAPTQTPQICLSATNAAFAPSTSEPDFTISGAPLSGVLAYRVGVVA